VVLLSGLLLGVVSVSPAKADQQFYRCVVNGKTIYTDKPCDAPTLPGVEVSSASKSGQPTEPNTQRGKSIDLDYTTPYGVWRGQAQYQASLKGQVIREAHAVVPMVIQVEEQGRVRGVSAENGCKLLGVAAPYVTPMVLTLDVTLSECRYPYFNRRYSGSLTLSQADNQVRLSLQSYNLGSNRNGGELFDIKATMRH